MNPDDMIFRTVFVDRDVDLQVLAQAKRAGASASSVYRVYLRAGLSQLKQGNALAAPSAEIAPVMRTAQVPVDVDEMLTALSCHLNVEKGELARRVVRQGMLESVRTMKDV